MNFDNEDEEEIVPEYSYTTKSTISDPSEKELKHKARRLLEIIRKMSVNYDDLKVHVKDAVAAAIANTTELHLKQIQKELHESGLVTIEQGRYGAIYQLADSASTHTIRNNHRLNPQRLHSHVARLLTYIKADKVKVRDSETALQLHLTDEELIEMQNQLNDRGWMVVSKGRSKSASVHDSTNEGSDRAALQSMQDQINAQLALNEAILKGRNAQEAAALATEQANIKRSFADRGDTDQGALNGALTANKALYEAKLKQADLEKAASMDASRTYSQQISDLQRVAETAAAAGHALSSIQIAATNDSYWKEYLASIDKTTLAVGNLGDGVSLFFRQMSRDSTSAAQSMHDVLSTAFEDVNSMLEKLVSGQKVNFVSLFRSMSAEIAKMGIQRGEQGLSGSALKMFGGGDKKPDDTAVMLAKTNSLLTDIRMALVGNSGTGNPATTGIGSVLGAAAGAGAGKSYGTSMISTMTSAALSAIPGGGLFSSILGGFGGHRATGGAVQAGVTYDVGEMGRESFTPTQNGVITPNNKMGGGVHFHAGAIDARGSTDPAQTEAAIHRAFAVYSPHIVAASQRAANEHAKRNPSKGR